MNLQFVKTCEFIAHQFIKMILPMHLRMNTYDFSHFSSHTIFITHISINISCQTILLIHNYSTTKITIFCIFGKFTNQLFHASIAFT